MYIWIDEKALTGLKRCRGAPARYCNVFALKELNNNEKIGDDRRSNIAAVQKVCFEKMTVHSELKFLATPIVTKLSFS